MTCRRCNECAESAHHWLDNGDFENSKDNANKPTGNSHVCKHCDAVGDECEDCDGIGDSGGIVCKQCNGEGVVVAKRRSWYRGAIG